jgi:hypothetical protein
MYHQNELKLIKTILSIVLNKQNYIKFQLKNILF